MHFESGWGKNLRRCMDLCSESARGIKDRAARRVFDMKLLQSCNCRESWPAFAFCEEDVKFRNENWGAKFDGKRVVTWDNTNVNLNFKPSALRIQRLTHFT